MKNIFFLAIRGFFNTFREKFTIPILIRIFLRRGQNLLYKTKKLNLDCVYDGIESTGKLGKRKNM